jgi:hypothetical protein
MKANAALYLHIFSLNSFPTDESSLKMLRRSEGGGREGGSFTWPWSQHNPNFGV